jgi:hypothetical protein
MKHCLTLVALFVAGMSVSAGARNVELPHGGHHSSGHHHSGGGHAGHYHAYHYHPNYYSHMHFYGGNCEKRYDRCVRRHPSHPSRCRECR